MPAGKSPAEDQRTAAVRRAEQQLAAHHRDRFAGLLSYGAVDIDPRHLVVWVLLSGEPADLPTWYFPGADGAGGCSAALLAELDDMRGVVVSCFAAEGWPDPGHIRVGFDSERRVTAGGGWQYFK